VICPFALDDGAYVLGALCPAERADFERHLFLCLPCRDSVAALAVLPGLLGRLDTATAAPPAAPAARSASILTGALATAARAKLGQRRRLRWCFAAAGLAVMMVATVVGFGVLQVTGVTSTPEVTMTAMRPVSDPMPISAEIGLRAVDSGTEIYMTCRYSADYSTRWTVRLVVYGVDASSPGASPSGPSDGPGGAVSGEGEQISSWSAAADQELTLTAMTYLDPSQIGRVELQRGDHVTLLTWTP
jgi:hypothetical protein